MKIKPSRALFLKWKYLILNVMRFALILFFTTTFGFNPLSGLSQNEKIHFVSDKTLTVDEVFDLIEENTSYHFIYRSDMFRDAPEVSVDEGEITVRELLNNSFTDLPVDFKINDRGNLVFSEIEEEDRQEKMITGTVTDEGDMPLPGVNITVEGTDKGTSTDFDGKYEIEVEEGQILNFSSVGFADQTAKVGDEDEINVVMEEGSALDEVVVVGYGIEKKINLSGSVSQVEDEYFESRPITNAGEALQGAIGNLNISRSSGQPGQNPDFNVRGYESLSGGSPLIVIDEVPSTSEEVNELNPMDIASVSVLKDAAAAAIYGSRASFGVVLITTKNATSDKLQVNVNSNFSFKKVTNLPKIITDPYQVAKYRNKMGKPWYDLYSDDARNYAKQVREDPNLPTTRLDDQDKTSWQYFARTDWFDEVYKDMAATQNYNANISQKTKKADYYLSAEFQQQKGMLKFNNDIHKRLNLRTKLNFEINDWLSIGNNSWFSNMKSNEPTANDWLFFHNVNRSPSLSPLVNPDSTYTSDYAETIGRLKSGSSISEKRSFSTKLNFEIKLLGNKWKLNGDATFKRSNAENDAYEIPFEYKDGPDKSHVTRKDSYVSFSSTPTAQDNYNIFTTFTDTFKKKHYLNIVAGYNQEEYFSDYKYAEKKDLISSDLPTVDLATGKIKTSQNKYSWSTQGFFYRLNYIFDDKYIVETNGRYDGSSRFPKGDRWAFNPSISAAWIISEENFFIQNSFINPFKIRASYGSLGNQSIDEYYPYIPSLSSGLTTSLLEGEQVTAVTSPGLVSPSLTWETVSTLNFGVDLGLFKNKLVANFDWYRRYTEDMLTVGKELPSVLGTGEPLENAADLVTTGWELEISWRDNIIISDKALNYSLRFNLADNKSIIKKFDNPSGSLNKHYEGEQIGEIWGLESLGYFQSDEEVANSPDQTAVASYPATHPVEAGDVKFADLNEDGVIDNGENTLENPGDYRKIGNSSPRYTFGLDINASWNGFDLRAFFQGVGKRDWYPAGGTHYFWGVYAQPWASLTEKNMDHWTPESPDAFFPRPKPYSAETGDELGIPQTRYLQDASYIRMKNLTIGYTIPKSALSATEIKRLRIYLSGENLFEFTNLYKYIDPEILGEPSAYPFQKTYSIGVSLTF